MDLGIKISKDGFDVSDTDPRNLVFSSEWDTYKVVTKQDIVLTANAGTYPEGLLVSGDYTHNLGYTPQVDCWVTDGSGVSLAVPDINPIFKPSYTGINLGRPYFNYYVDGSKIYAQVFISVDLSSTKTYKFTFFIYENEIV